MSRPKLNVVNTSDITPTEYFHLFLTRRKNKGKENNNKLNNQNPARLVDYIKVLPQYLIPQHALSRAVYRITRCEWKLFKNLLIKSFIAWFKVDMSLAKQSNLDTFRHFNDFFTRELKPEIRPVTQDMNVIVCPVDGSISQIGKINSGNIFQAKGRSYHLNSLLVNEKNMVEHFKDGQFTTLYLSPRDYHRIHMPLDGELTKMTYVPGKLFAVNNHSVKVIDRLFSRNERVISYFETSIGTMAIVMVGAINVGSMETVWAGEITPAKNRIISTTDYNNQDFHLKRGAEMGRFNMGSTVIILFGNNRMQWAPEMQADKPVCMGMSMGRLQER